MAGRQGRTEECLTKIRIAEMQQKVTMMLESMRMNF